MSSTPKTYINPAHVRSVRLAGNSCSIEPVRYAMLDDVASRVYTRDLDPEAFAACVGVHMFFQKQRVQTDV